MFKKVIKKIQYIVLRYKLNREIEITQKNYRKGKRIILRDYSYYQPIDKEIIQQLKEG